MSATIPGVVRWVEPYYGPGELPVHVHCACTAEHAINYSRNRLAGRPDIPPQSDEAMLDDFLATHWAAWDADWTLPTPQAWTGADGGEGGSQ